MKPRILLLLLAVPAMLPAQDAVGKSLRANWAATKRQLLDVADAMPEDKYGFKATAEQRTFGEQLTHLAEATFSVAARVAGESPQKREAPKDKAGIIRLLGESFDAGDAALAKLTDAQATEAVKMGQNETTRLRMAIQGMTNAWNHYGQLVVYLRLNGIVPPASRPRR
jgi:uncharacterized damage-inducible protein DinB